jgi:hypothetical protein
MMITKFEIRIAKMRKRVKEKWMEREREREREREKGRREKREREWPAKFFKNRHNGHLIAHRINF